MYYFDLLSLLYFPGLGGAVGAYCDEKQELLSTHHSTADLQASHVLESASSGSL